MAITYSLGPNPKWYFVDMNGKPLGAGYIAFFRALNPTEQKLIYEDPAGINPWPTVTVPNVGVQGVLIDENGTQGPFYFEADSSDLDETYYFVVYDTNGIQQWDQNDYLPSGSGGGGNVTTAYNIENLVANSVMYRNIGQSIMPAPAFLAIAPGAHAGLSATTANAGPDINFIRNSGSNANDQLTFLPFTPFGLTPFTNDVTPTVYLNYTCSNNASSETQKVVQFPITQNVTNLAGQGITITLWAKASAGSNNLTIFLRQFFGDGSGHSSDVITSIQTLTLTNQWQKFTVSTTIPSVALKTVGKCYNDGLFLQIGYPLGLACNIDFAKPSFYLGDISPQQDYVTFDDIESIVNNYRTGDIKTSLNSFSPFGFVPMNDGTIGDEQSNATTRAAIDTFPLYNLIWNAVQNNQAYAPMYTSAGAAVAYTDPITDYTDHNQISLTKSLGQVLAGCSNIIPTAQTYTVNTGTSTSILTVTNAVQYGTGSPVVLTNSGGAAPLGLTVGVVYYSIFISSTTMRLATSLANALSGTFVTFSNNGSGTNSIQLFNNVIGSIRGEETHTQSIDEMPAHTHPPLNAGFTFEVHKASSGTLNFATAAGNDSTFDSTTGSTGGGTPFNVMQPTTYMNVFIKL